MSEQEMRDEFEAWCLGLDRACMSNGEYFSYATASAWQAWKEAMFRSSARVGELEEALRECQAALAVLTEPREIRTTTVHQAWGIAVAAEQKARAALSKATGSAEGTTGGEGENRG